MSNKKAFFKRLGRLGGISLLIGSLLSSMLLSTGCSESPSASETGEVVISLTDAEGDFLTYAVDVTSLKLTRNDGAVVQSLPQSTTVDFAQYVDVTEFLTAASVPAGQYVAAELTLDFSQALVTVQNVDGGAVVANVIDETGAAVTTKTVDIQLNGDTRFQVRPGVPAHFTIDFDLESSNTVVIDGDTATVTVNPVLIADTQLKEPKPHRLRGLLGQIDSNNANFEVVMRPFIHHRNDAFGAVNAYTESSTVYEINGIEYTGSAGFAELSALDKGTAVVTMGMLNIESGQYVAGKVIAGTSVPWGHKDILRGSVISRDQNTLTVHGGVVLRAAGGYLFKETASVLIDENTRVFKQDDSDVLHNINEISVGQRVTILGTPAITIGDGYVLDATEGTVRMHYSQVTGLINTVSPLAIEAQRINSRRVAVYDFTGTGSDVSMDADPANYEINTGLLPLDQLSINDPIKVRGFPSVFGAAPEDFIANTLIDVSQVTTHLLVGYTEQGSDTAITSVDETGIQLSLDGIGNAHYLESAGVIIDLADLDSVPFISPKQSGEGLFVISEPGHVNVFADYASFQQALNDKLTTTAAIRGVNVFGRYDSDTNTIEAGKITVRFVSQIDASTGTI